MHAEVLLEMPLKVIANLLLSQPQSLAKPAAPPPEEKKEIIAAPAPAPVPELIAGPIFKPVAPVPQAPPPASNPSIATAGQATSKPSGGTKFSGGNTQFARRETIAIPMATVSGGWPETLRKQIEDLNLASSVLNVPVETLEGALKSGKVAFLWKQVCQWLDACPPEAFASSFSDVPLEWPLSVIAPLFMQRRPQKAPKSKAAAMDIPDVFAHGNRPAAAPAAPAPEPEPEAQAPEPRPQRRVQPQPQPEPQLQRQTQPQPQPQLRAAASPVAEPDEALAAPAARRSVPEIGRVIRRAGKAKLDPERNCSQDLHPAGTGRGLKRIAGRIARGQLHAARFEERNHLGIFAANFWTYAPIHERTQNGRPDERRVYSGTWHPADFQRWHHLFRSICKPGESLPTAELNLIARELSRHTK